MLYLKIGLLLKLQLCFISALVFHLTGILFLLTDLCTGQSQGAEPAQTIVTLAGKDVTLPCHLNPALDAFSQSVEWARPDLEPRFVHVWHQGQNILVDQNPSYRGRTSVSPEKLKHGDLSLELSELRHSDNGKYRCYFPSQEKEYTVELVVGSVSSPVLAEMYLSSSSVALVCKSAGWYPEPEVLWLDGEGNLLSAGPTETVRGPDDLYTVSSRVTVEKRHSNSFTCRVQQKDTNQTREAQITVADDILPCRSAALIGVIVALILIFILAAAFVGWKWKQNQIKETKKAERSEREKLMEENKKQEERKVELEKILKINKEVQNNLDSAVETLMEQMNELQEQREKIKKQKEKMEKNIKNIEEELKSVEKMAEIQRYGELQKIVLAAKEHLIQRKHQDDDFVLAAEKALTKTESLLEVLTDKKQAAEEQKEKLEEIKEAQAE